MKDFLGRDLEIGQYVVYSPHTTTTSLDVGVVLGFSNQKVKIRTWRKRYNYQNGKYIPTEGWSHKFPESLCVIPADDGVLFHLKNR